MLDDGCLVMFTDGLLERRGTHFGDRLAALEASLGSTPVDDPGVVADFVIEAMTADGRSSDDIVVLTARRREADKPALRARNRLTPSTGCGDRRGATLPILSAVTSEAALAPLVGAHQPVPCLDGSERPYRDLDCGASTPALQAVADRVAEFLPWYSSVHRGAGYKSRRATADYESARGQRVALRQPIPRRRRRRHFGAQHDRSHQPPGLPPAPRTRRRGGDHGGRASRQSPALVPGSPAALGGMRHRRDLRPRRRRPRPR